MLTFDKMQNTNPLMCTKFEIWGQGILEVIQAFHTVRIFLYIGCSGPVVKCCLNKINMNQSTTWPNWLHLGAICSYKLIIKIKNKKCLWNHDFKSSVEPLFTIVIHRCELWQTAKTQMKYCIMWHYIRVWTVCLEKIIFRERNTILSRNLNPRPLDIYIHHPKLVYPLLHRLFSEHDIIYYF